MTPQQAYTVWRDADREFRHSYRGSMRWRSVNGADYLYRIYSRTETSLGRRSAETEQTKTEYTERRTRLRQRTTTLLNRLARMAKVNRAYGIGRVPVIAARVLRKLDEAGVLGVRAFVVGTHALFAYECRAGLQFDNALTSTDDLDLLWDARQKLTLALLDDRVDGVIGLLKKIDHTFDVGQGHFRAENNAGFHGRFHPAGAPQWNADRQRAADGRRRPVGGCDRRPAMARQCPEIRQIAIGEDGQPVWMCCVDPRVFGLHKYWVSNRDREPVKRRRDAEPAKAVAILASQYLRMDFQGKDLSALPINLTRTAKELVAVIGDK